MSRQTYILPLRRAHYCRAEAEEWAKYLATLGDAGCEVIVVDGSDTRVFVQHDIAFGANCRHVRVDRGFGYLNDKVNGIHTGLRLASFEKIVVADDDIRYNDRNLAKVLDLLDHYEVVRPQNFLTPLPWWGLMECSRMLINRAVLRAADYPGTCAFRLEAMKRVGSYDGDVLFDNEEMLRHFIEKGVSVAYASDLFIEKRTPGFRKWLEQRPRQAYEDFGLRGKTSLFLMLPLCWVALGMKLSSDGLSVALALSACSSILLALYGRMRGEAAQFFPLRCCFAAPFWITERALSTYLAVWWYVTRGGYPFGGQLLSRSVGRSWRSGGKLASLHLRKIMKGRTNVACITR